MEKFLVMKILCISVLYFTICYISSIRATVSSEDHKVYLNISDDYIDVKLHETMCIKCSGSPPLKWEYKSPVGSPEGSYTKEMFGSNSESIIRLKFHNQDATGKYTCKNNFSEASVYIFVNGDHLILSNPFVTIYSGNKYITCIPTASGANVTLWKINQRSFTGVPVPLGFDKTKGFLAKLDPDYFNGIFECIAEFGSKNETADVFVEVVHETSTTPLVSINSSNEIYASLGSSFSLTCIVQTDAYARIHVTWSCPNQEAIQKNVTEVVLRDATYMYVNSTLSTLKAVESDTGSYACRALDHSQRENLAEVEVIVYDPVVNSKVYLNISDEYIDVKVHETVYIKCSGIPPLKWEYNNPLGWHDFGFSKEEFSSNNESIIRLNLDHEEETGRYTCKNKYSEASVYIFVNGDRLILSDAYVATFSGNKYISCIPTTSEANVTLWKINESFSRVHVPVEFDKTKGFRTTLDPDYFSGIFQCVAEFEGMEETADVLVENIRDTSTVPIVSIDSSNTKYLLVGSNFNLTCNVQADIGTFLHVTWSYPNQEKTEKKVTEDFLTNANYMYMNSTLSLSRATGKDSGSYICRVMDHSLRENSAKVDINVQGIPNVHIRLDSPCCFYPGEKYNISCEIEGYHQPYVTWSWKPFPFNEIHQSNSSNVTSSWTTFEKYYDVNNSTVRTVTEENRIISYLSVVGEVSGFYKCKAENKLGEAEVEKLFVVTDAENGFEVIYEAKNSKGKAESIALCKASTVLYSDVQWKRISMLTNESATVSTARQDFTKNSFSLQTRLMENIESDYKKYACCATLRTTGQVQKKSFRVNMRGIVHF